MQLFLCLIKRVTLSIPCVRPPSALKTRGANAGYFENVGGVFESSHAMEQCREQMGGNAVYKTKVQRNALDKYIGDRVRRFLAPNAFVTRAGSAESQK